MKTFVKKAFALGTAFALPSLAFAQQVTSVQSGGQFVINFINTVAVPVLFALAFIVFIFGVFQYFILSHGDEEKATGAKNLMLYGLIGFFLMVSIWGLVNILIGSVSLNSNVPVYPSTPAAH